MVRVVNTFEYGNNLHLVYVADRVGDELPLHQHEDRGHLTICMAGEIEAFFPDREPIAARPGDAPFEFGISRLHGIRAKTNGTMFMSVVASAPRHSN